MEVSVNGGIQNGWFRIENPIQMDDLGGTPISGNLNIFVQDEDP